MATYLIPYVGQTESGAPVSGRAILDGVPEPVGRAEVFAMEAEIMRRAVEEEGAEPMRVASVTGFFRLAD